MKNVKESVQVQIGGCGLSRVGEGVYGKRGGKGG